MSQEKPLFPNSKIEEPRPVNTQDNDSLISSRKRKVFEKDAAKQREKTEVAILKRRKAAKTENTCSAENRERTRMRKSA